MPDMNGIEATRRITTDEALAGVKILILTTYETDALVAAALRAGASGYLGKGTKPDFLLHSIRTRPTAARSSADEPARAYCRYRPLSQLREIAVNAPQSPSGIPC